MRSDTAQTRRPWTAAGVSRHLRSTVVALLLYGLGIGWNAVAAPIVPVGVDRLVSLYSADGLFGTPGCSGPNGFCLRQQSD